MSEFVLHNIISIKDNSGDLRINEKGIFISILDAASSPPHLIMVVRGYSFSLSVNGFKYNKKLQDLIRLISSKKIKTIFVELVSPTNKIVDSNILINKLMQTCKTLELGKVTCLFPIKEFCRLAYNLDLSKVEFIFDLLPILEKEELVKNSYSFNMNDDLISGGYCLKTYGFEEINNRIQDMQFR